MLDSKSSLFNSMVAHGKVVVLYQPKVNSLSREIVGFEALARLGNYENLISPILFVDTLTYSMHIRLFITVLNIIQKDIKSGIFKNKKIGINIEPKILINPTINKVLSSLDLEISKMLCVEIIEKPIPSSDWGEIYKTMSHLKKTTKISFALDDFGVDGAGFKSLHLPGVSEVKLDGSLIPRNKDQKIIFENTTTMLKSIGMKITLEMVETEEEANELKYMVDEFQGYLFGKPVSIKQLVF